MFSAGDLLAIGAAEHGTPPPEQPRQVFANTSGRSSPRMPQNVSPVAYSNPPTALGSPSPLLQSGAENGQRLATLAPSTQTHPQFSASSASSHSQQSNPVTGFQGNASTNLEAENPSENSEGMRYGTEVANPQPVPMDNWSTGGHPASSKPQQDGFPVMAHPQPGMDGMPASRSLASVDDNMRQLRDHLDKARWRLAVVSGQLRARCEMEEKLKSGEVKDPSGAIMAETQAKKSLLQIYHQKALLDMNLAQHQMMAAMQPRPPAPGGGSQPGVQGEHQRDLGVAMAATQADMASFRPGLVPHAQFRVLPRQRAPNAVNQPLPGRPPVPVFEPRVRPPMAIGNAAPTPNPGMVPPTVGGRQPTQTLDHFLQNLPDSANDQHWSRSVSPPGGGESGQLSSRGEAGDTGSAGMPSGGAPSASKVTVPTKPKSVWTDSPAQAPPTGAQGSRLENVLDSILFQSWPRRPAAEPQTPMSPGELLDDSHAEPPQWPSASTTSVLESMPGMTVGDRSSVLDRAPGSHRPVGQSNKTPDPTAASAKSPKAPESDSSEKTVSSEIEPSGWGELPPLVQPQTSTGWEAGSGWQSDDSQPWKKAPAPGDDVLIANLEAEIKSGRGKFSGPWSWNRLDGDKSLLTPSDMPEVEADGLGGAAGKSNETGAGREKSNGSKASSDDEAGATVPSSPFLLVENIPTEVRRLCLLPWLGSVVDGYREVVSNV